MIRYDIKGGDLPVVIATPKMDNVSKLKKVL